MHDMLSLVTYALQLWWKL